MESVSIGLFVLTMIIALCFLGLALWQTHEASSYRIKYINMKKDREKETERLRMDLFKQIERTRYWRNVAVDLGLKRAPMTEASRRVRRAKDRVRGDSPRLRQDNAEREGRCKDIW